MNTFTQYVLWSQQKEAYDIWYNAKMKKTRDSTLRKFISRAFRNQGKAFRMLKVNQQEEAN